MAFVLTGWIILLLIITSLLQLIGNPIGSILAPIAASLYIIYLADFMLFCVFRKIPYLSYLTFPIFKLFDFISLRFFYQPGIDYLSSNVARWKTALFFICFVICAGIFTYLSIQKRLHWPNIFDGRKYREALTIDDEFHSLTFYRSANAEGVERVSIQSDIITEPVLNLFISYSIRYDEFIEQIKEEDRRYFQNIFSITVDDSLYTKQKFYSTTLYGNGTFDRGISNYIDISSFKNGLHELKIKAKHAEEPNHIIIPFWLHKESFE